MIRFLFGLFKAAFFFALLGAGGWFYWQHHERLESEKLKQALEQKDYAFLSERYNNLKLKDSSSASYLEKCYYKALALQNLKHSAEAKPFWEHLAKFSQNLEQRGQAFYFLGLQAAETSNEKEALLYLSKEELSDPKSPLYGAAVLEIVKISDKNKQWDAAVDSLRAAIKVVQEPSSLQALKTLCGDINLKRLHSRLIVRNSVDHEVSSGESLVLIAQQFNTTVDLLMKTNDLKRPLLRPHNHLKVFTGVFSAQISKSKNTLLLLENEEFFKEYFVGTGKDNVTPVGDFQITGKQANPTWYRPDGSVIPFGDKENFLGTRWMSIDYPGYGIHGTWDEQSVGKQSSAGCVRLKNTDVEELFTIVPLHTKIKIIE